MVANPLTDADLEHFYTYGHVVIRGAFPKERAEEAADRAFQRLGYDRRDPATWAEAKIHLAATRSEPMSEFSPRTWAACCQLMGGEERVSPSFDASDGYIVNLSFKADEPWTGPTPESGGWHKDGDFFRHFLDSPEQGLLSIMCWTDLVHQGGATFVARDSVPVVARYLLAHPEGVPGGGGCAGLIKQCRDLVEITAEAGDIFLIHPFVLHASSPNLKRAVRIITNPPAQLKEPMNFNRDDPAEFSPVERAILRGLGVDRLDFQITGQRERIESEGARQRKRRLAEEKARLG